MPPIVAAVEALATVGKSPTRSAQPSVKTARQSWFEILIEERPTKRSAVLSGKFLRSGFAAALNRPNQQSGETEPD